MSYDKRSAYIIVFLLGLLGIFAQTFIFRELTATLRANELVLSLLLFHWLFGNALGTSFGIPVRGIGWKFALYLILIPCNVFLLKIYTLATQGTSGEFIALPKLLLITTLLLFPFCYLSGSIFLEISRIFIGLGGKPYKLYAADALGGFIGGFLTFLVIARLPGVSILTVSGITGALIFVVLLRRFWFVLVVVLLAILAPFSNRLSEKLDQALWRGFSVKSSESVYGKLSILERAGEKYLYENGSLTVASGDSTTKEILTYPVFSQVDTIENVYIAGGIALGVLGQILEYKPKRVTVVEMDPGIMAVAREFVPERYFEAREVQMKLGDPRYILKHSKERYDVIELFLPNPTSGLINRLYTKEFFAEVKEHLTTRGVFAFSLTVGENYLSRFEQLMTRAIYRSMAEVFLSTSVFSAGSIIIMIGSLGGTIKEPVVAINRKIDEKLINPRFLFGKNLEFTFEQFRQKRITDLIEFAGRDSPNTDMKPIAYVFGLLNWTRELNLSPEFFTRIAYFVYIFLVLLVLLAKILSYIIFKERVFWENLLFISIWGAGAMILQLSALYFYQASSGYLYWALGCLTGGMMLGLAFGSKLSGSLQNFKIWIRVIGATGVMWSLILFALSYKTSALSSLKGSTLLFIFLPFMVIHGAMVGALYPQNVNWMKARGLFGDRRMGVAYTFDLIGASFGALFIGTLLIPVIGIKTNLLLWILTLSIAIPWRL